MLEKKNRKGQTLLQARRSEILIGVRVALKARRAQQKSGVRNKRLTLERVRRIAREVKGRLHGKIFVKQQNSEISHQFPQYFMRFEKKTAQRPIERTEEQKSAQ